MAVQSITQLKNQDYGFPTENVFTARVGLPEAQYGDSAAQLRFLDQLQARVVELRGAESVALATALPALGTGMDRVALEGKAYATERDYPFTRVASVSPGYFSTFQVSVDGRDFTAQDRMGSVPVAIVNESFAKLHFPGRSAVGGRFRLGGPDSRGPWLTVVGVVPDMWMQGPESDDEDPQGVYLPLASCR
jgi:hypothetical protein